MKCDSKNMKILCIGVGGAGTNVINRMKDIGIPNAELLAFGGYRTIAIPKFLIIILSNRMKLTHCQQALDQKSLKSWRRMLRMI